MPQPDIIYGTPKGADQVTTDVYTDVGFTSPGGGLVTILRNPGFGPASLIIANTGLNSITRQVLGANRADIPEAEWVVVTAGTAIAAGTSNAVAYGNIYQAFLRVQVRATAGGSQGAARADLRLTRDVEH